ncbi:MAG: hypothetical protein OXH94_14595, partial [Rhodospirillales bacterium]|nr:hypothetical protein [Rhodospirillales bacterium]
GFFSFFSAFFFFCGRLFYFFFLKFNPPPPPPGGASLHAPQSRRCLWLAAVAEAIRRLPRRRRGPE